MANRNYKLEVYQDVKLVSEAHIQTEEIYSSAQVSKQNGSYIQQQNEQSVVAEDLAIDQIVT